jgi:hypothetical protein
LELRLLANGKKLLNLRKPNKCKEHDNR